MGDMDNGSTEKQVAEEINGFSALSGPVTVAKEGAAKFVVTFDAADGDVAQLVAHGTGTGSAMVVTRENGWSIEGPIGANLDTMQAGGTINITAQEVCKFTVTTTNSNGDNIGTDEKYYFCYDGVCGSKLEELSASNPVNAIHSIKDNNGNQILSVTGNAALSGKVYTVTMPLGKSCDGLEMRVKTAVKTAAITKSVNKHNNGKVFKITRSFLKIEQTTPGAPSGAGEFTFTGGEGHSALARVSTLVVSDKSSCPAKTATDYDFPFNRVVTGFKTAHGGAAAIVEHTALSAHDGSVNAA